MEEREYEIVKCTRIPKHVNIMEIAGPISGNIEFLP